MHLLILSFVSSFVCLFARSFVGPFIRYTCGWPKLGIFFFFFFFVPCLGSGMHSSSKTPLRTLKEHNVALSSAPELQSCLSLTAAKAHEQTRVWTSLVARLLLGFWFLSQRKNNSFMYWFLDSFYSFIIYLIIYIDSLIYLFKYRWRVSVQATRVMQELVHYYQRLANGSTIFCLDTNVSFATASVTTVTPCKLKQLHLW